MRASPRSNAEALALRAQAKAYQEQQDLPAAEKAYGQAAELHERQGIYQEAAVDAYEAFRIRYRDTARPDLALDRLHQAWTLAQKTEDTALQRRVLQGAFAILYFTADLARCQQALDAFRARIEPNDLESLSVWHNNAAVLDKERGRYRAARRHLNDAQKIDLRLYPGDPSFSILVNLVTVNIALHDPQTAAQHLDALIKTFGDGSNTPETPVTPYLRVRLARASNRPADAIKLADTVLAKDIDPTWARDLEYERARALEAQGDLEAAEQGYRRSIAHVETLRRDVRIDDFKPASIGRYRKPFEALFLVKQKQGQSREALQVVEQAKGRNFIDALSLQKPRPPLTQTLSLAQSRDRAQELLRLWPALQRSQTPPVPPAAEFLDRLSEQQLLVYFRTGDQVWRIALLQGHIDISAIELSIEALEAQVDRLVADPNDADAARTLGQAVMPPLPLDPDKPLYIAPDDRLLHIPFALLHVRGKPLIEDHHLAYVPSAGSLALALNRTRTSSPATSAVVMAAGHLAGAKAEAQWVAKRLSVPAWTEDQASVQALAKAKTARVLHIASHAGVGPINPWLTLADQPLFPHTILTLGLQPRLVVLSGCASGIRLGNERWGSLASAFFASGAHAVVATRWTIDDAQVVRMMNAFYEEGGAERPIVALGRAQRRLRTAGVDPAVWAAFFVLGVPPFD